MVSIPFREDLHSDVRDPAFISLAGLAVFPSLSGKTFIRTERNDPRDVFAGLLVSIPFREELYSGKKLVEKITNAVFQSLIDLIKEKRVLRIRGFGVFKYEPSGDLRHYYNPRKNAVES